MYSCLQFNQIEAWDAVFLVVFFNCLPLCVLGDEFAVWVALCPASASCPIPDQSAYGREMSEHMEAACDKAVRGAASLSSWKRMTVRLLMGAQVPVGAPWHACPPGGVPLPGSS